MASSSTSSTDRESNLTRSIASAPPPFQSILTPGSFSPASVSISRPIPSYNSSRPPPPLPPSSSSPSNSDIRAPEGKHNKHISAGLIAGIGAAVGVGGVAILLLCCLFFVNRIRWSRKKKKPHNSMKYYADQSTRKESMYYISDLPQNWGDGPQGMPHAVKAQPPPGLHGQVAGGWHIQSPSTMMSSSEISSVFSGQHAPPLPPPSPTLALGFNNSTFTYEELAAATNNFSQTNLLGQGGFGYVHKGVLQNRKEIAVKSLKSESRQGDREFHAEVDTISRVHHRHLASLVGYCIAGSQRLLVYDFVPNRTLEYHLHGKGLPVMEWPIRLKIAIGSAKGIAYLHEDCHPKIIHRDIKASNILLDFKFEALVADFGLAKLSSDNHTHVSTRVMGTFGYLAPEYASSGKLTEKSDVFSYGVMLLELITGKRPVDSSHTFMEDSLVDWARPALSQALADGNYDHVADPHLNGNYDTMEMARMIACAAACVRHSARRRPKMSQIVHALEGDVLLEDLNEGMRPGQSMLFSSSSDYDSDLYASNMKKIRMVALPSPDFTDDFSGPIAEYGISHELSSSDSDGAYSDEHNPVVNRHRHPLR